MHILVVEALLIAFYSTGDEQILIHKRKPCRSRTCLVRYTWSLSSCAFSAGSCPAEVYECAYEPANSHRHAAYSQQFLSLFMLYSEGQEVKNSELLYHV